MSSKTKYRVGVNYKNYPELRNIWSFKSSEFEHKRVWDKVRFWNGIRSRLGMAPKAVHTFQDYGLNKVDLLHFFNGISWTNKPWVTTFENELPRHDGSNQVLANRLAHESCKQLIALCENARQIQGWWLQEHHPEIKEAVENKITVLHPPQQKLVSNYEEKQLEVLTFTFVGNAFYHKAGLEMLRAFDKIWSDGGEVRLNIISKFSKVGWFDQHVEGRDEQEVQSLLKKHENFIRIESNLNSSQVAEVFKHSHVALLPSFGETYGYSVLEAQATATPVITTNAWAFPEINSNEIGWLLDLPTKTKMGGLRGDFEPTQNIREYGDLLTQSLYSCITDILNEPELVKLKGTAALNKIDEMHSPDHFDQVLTAIYKKALG